MNPRPLGYEPSEASFSTGQYRARLSGIGRQQSRATHRLCGMFGPGQGMWQNMDVC
jgi:hypothetical protein